MMMENNDYLVTARAANDQIRAIAITSKSLVEEKRKLHNLSPIAGAAIGRLMSAALMMGDWLKNETDTLTIEIAGEGKLSHLTAVSNNKGEVRGYVSNPDVVLPPNASGHLNVGGAIGKGHMTIIRDLGLKTPYVSQLNLVSGEIAEDLTYYFAQSEQTPSAVGLGVHFDKETVEVNHAGGFIIQLMPNTNEETIARLEENLKNIPSVTTMLEKNGDSPEKLLQEVLAGFDLVFEKKKDVRWKCNCNEERGERILTSLTRKELLEILDEGKPVEMNCSFCGKQYTYSLSEIRNILAKKGVVTNE